MKASKLGLKLHSIFSEMDIMVEVDRFENRERIELDDFFIEAIGGFREGLNAWTRSHPSISTELARMSGAGPLAVSLTLLAAKLDSAVVLDWLHDNGVELRTSHLVDRQAGQHPLCQAIQNKGSNVLAWFHEREGIDLFLAPLPSAPNAVVAAGRAKDEDLMFWMLAKEPGLLDRAIPIGGDEPTESGTETPTTDFLGVLGIFFDDDAVIFDKIRSVVAAREAQRAVAGIHSEASPASGARP